MLKYKRKYLNNFYRVLFSLMLFFVLTAFGCKKDIPEEVDTNSEESTDQIVYNTQTNGTDNITELNNNSVNVGENNESTNENVDNSSLSEEDKVREQAEMIVEIYGTYTNKDKEAYKNLKDIKQYSTIKLQQWLDNKSKVKNNPNTDFYGVTVKALSSVVIENKSEKKDILVTVKSEEITAETSTPKISYKIILITFTKVENEFKLSGLYWQN